MARGWLLASVALGLCFGIVFAAYPLIDLEVARLFFDDHKDKFPIAITYEWNLVRQLANWIPFLLLVPALFALLRKIVFPGSKMLIAPSVVVFLIGSFIVGPGLTSNLLLKENWGRPRPNHVQQFAGAADFQPWWRPGGACESNCSFVSGEASQAFWVVAPATLAPPQLRPVAMGTAVVFGASVGAMRIVFGRHFVSDIIFAGVITIAIVMALYYLLLNPVRRNDARLERLIERASISLHETRGRCSPEPGPRSPMPGVPSATPDSTCTSASPAYSRGEIEPYRFWPPRGPFPCRPTSRRWCLPIPAGSTPRSF